MYYDVTLFNMANPKETRHEIIEANSREEAEKTAVSGGLINLQSGWGVLDSTRCNASGEELIEVNPPGKEETITVFLSKEKTPVAFENKIKELLLEGAFDSREKAERWLRETPIVLELYYEKGCGLFAVESDALESSGIRSPYSGNEMIG